MLRVAIALAVSEPVPRVVVTPLKVSWGDTAPVGVPVPGLTTATVAVKVTDWPKDEGLTEEVRLGEVAAGERTARENPEGSRPEPVAVAVKNAPTRDGVD